MMQLQAGLYVVISQLETVLAPQPKPLEHGFSRDVAYLALGAFSLSESGDAFFILSNDEDQIWFISNRHLRTYELRPDSTAFRFPLSKPALTAQRNGHHLVTEPRKQGASRLAMARSKGKKSSNGTAA